MVPDRAFCTIPHSNTEVPLPELSTVVGNPPYLRQEKIEDKRHQADVVASRWHGLRLSGRSDTHCYFWPAAAALLKEDGYFGFLTSSSWLDVEYGFALQRWILQNFRLVAVMESAAEPWFPDARVKTCVTILQRCSGQEARDATLVKFVQFKRSLAEIIGVPPDQHLMLTRLIPMQLRRRGVEMKFIIDGTSKMSAKVVPALVRLVARAHCWFEDLVSGRASSMVEIGKREKIGKRHVSEIIRLAFLAPDIVEQIVNGVQPPELTARILLQKSTRLPLDWESQHKFLGFPYPA